MKKIKPYAEHQLQQLDGKATFEQCQMVWALLKVNDMKAVWIDDMSYAQAVRLITLLQQLRQQKYIRPSM
jgi:hypothetical protein